MNRADRRRIARQAGLHPDQIRAAKRADRVSAKLEARVLKMKPTEARRLLAAWAARTDHDQADIDLLNGVANHDHAAQ